MLGENGNFTGFDIVIGNPPYERIQGIRETNSAFADEFTKRYKSATGSFDLYAVFAEQGLRLISKDGMLNYIMPVKWTNAAFGKGPRSVVSETHSASKIINFGAYQVFSASTYTGLQWLKPNCKELIYHELDRDLNTNQEHEFKENLCTILPELDTFIKTTIANRRPIPVSALREEPVVDYPDWATRELLMNAICHRDYSTNGPIQFYQYDDRIEIMNHGGLYGRANEENFPNVNDYRNIVVAEAMKVLGFVNRHSRGVLRVQKDLRANENGEAVYDFGYQTAVLVRENKSPLGERMMADAIANGFLLENGEKRSDVTTSESSDFQKGSPKRSEKGSNMTENDEEKSQKQTRKQTKNPPRLKIPETDMPMYSKMELGARRVRRDMIPKLAELYKVEESDLMTLWLADAIYAILKEEDEKLRLNAIDLAKEYFQEQ